MCLWQFALIARNDDICHFKVEDPRGHPDYNFALITRVRWSKNIHEERNCPDQILFGSMDDSVCLLIQLGIHLESYLSQYPRAEYLFTADGSDNAVNRLKNRFRNNLDKLIWKSDEFKLAIEQQDIGQGVGTHSQRKFPATYARRQGCTSEEIEVRGRWKRTNNRVVHRYIDVRQHYIDAKVAGKLCIG